MRFIIDKFSNAEITFLERLELFPLLRFSFINSSFQILFIIIYKVTLKMATLYEKLGG